MVGRGLLSELEAERLGYRGVEAARRRQVLRETLDALQSADPPDRYHRLAASNLERWRNEVAVGRGAVHVQVFPDDWGEVTRALTKRYGRCFAVLNMANAYVPGGGYVEGAVAQEENMFRRTDCHFHVRPDEYDASENRYVLSMTRLLSGCDGVVWIDTTSPRVCIRGPEDRTASDLGYPWLDDDEIFPFFELRAAAQDLRGGAPFDATDARRRIAAQLDTLRRDGIRHAVLGAAGCGAFRNPTRAVAEIYREEIEERESAFDVIAFAVYAAGYGPDNYTPFSEVFASR